MFFYKKPEPEDLPVLLRCALRNPKRRGIVHRLGDLFPLVCVHENPPFHRFYVKRFFMCY